MRLTLVQEELPALPDFASSAWGEEYLLPFVYEKRKQFHVHATETNKRLTILDSGVQAGCGEKIKLGRRSVNIQIVFCEFCNALSPYIEQCIPHFKLKKGINPEIQISRTNFPPHRNGWPWNHSKDLDACTFKEITFL